MRLHESGPHLSDGKQAKGWVFYPIGSRPRIGLAILLGIQNYLTMFGATILIPYIMGGAMKLPQDELALLISTMFFASGITTLFQVSKIGNNLPIVQGGTFSFLGPALSIVAMVAAQNLGWKVQSCSTWHSCATGRPGGSAKSSPGSRSS